MIEDQPDAATAPPVRRRAIVGRPRFAGVVGAILFAWASFMPTMMPRTIVAQALIGALCIATGYACFTLLGWPATTVVRRRLIDITPHARRMAWTVTCVAAGLVAVVGDLWMWVRWRPASPSSGSVIAPAV